MVFNIKKSLVVRGLLATGFLCICSIPHFSHAAGFSVSPRIIDLSAEPRDVLTETIVIKADDATQLFPFVNNVSVGHDGGIEEFVPPSMSDRTNTLTSWLEISRSGVEMKAGETKEIPLTIRVNPTAAPGKYHALISYASGGNATEAENVMKIGNAQSIMLNVTIEDKRTEALSLSRFLVKRFVTSPNNAAISYNVENSGDLLIEPRGNIILYNQRGEEVASVVINPDKVTVPVGETRFFTARAPIEGLLGKYKAYMTMQYGEGQATVYDTVYFYALPWKMLLSIFAVFIIIAIAFSLFIHHRYFRAVTTEDADEVPVTLKDSFSHTRGDDIVMKR